jgi:hypothetical protein
MALRADAMLAKGDVGGALTWQRIVRAVEELARQQRRSDEALN